MGTGFERGFVGTTVSSVWTSVSCLDKKLKPEKCATEFEAVVVHKHYQLSVNKVQPCTFYTNFCMIIYEITYLLMWPAIVKSTKEFNTTSQKRNRYIRTACIPTVGVCKMNVAPNLQGKNPANFEEN